jgi:peptidoglycan/LPS O-acetylase OafA/YrhL
MHKPKRFTILDGMRGIAAVAVVAGHAGGQISGGDLIPNIGLAVPFFFMLSGFVLSHAYREGLGKRGATLEFAKQRVIRLFPLIVLAGLLGSVVLAYRFSHGELMGVSTTHVVIAQLLSVTSLPTPFLVIDSWRWPVDPPEWSLFYELLASAALAAGLLNASKRTLVAFSASGFLVCAWLGFSQGMIAPGLVGQIALTTFSFPFGCLIYRAYRDELLPSRSSPVLATIALTLALFWPAEFDYRLQLIILLLLVPMIIWTSLGRQPHGSLRKGLDYLGEMSYPLYILHWPILVMVKEANPALPILAVILLVLAASVLVSHIALFYYDTPVRRALRNRYGRAKQATTLTVNDLMPPEK